jgi:predicted transcriptional regulator
MATGVAASTLEGSSPISKVVKMLEKTLKDVTEERNLKEKDFEKTSCLTKKTTENNNKIIEDSQADIDNLNNELSLLGSVTLTDEGRVLAGKIDDKNKEITALNEELKTMTDAHNTHMTDLDAGIAALIDAEA